MPLYEPVFPRATYSPWNGDARFQEVMTTIREHTMVDEYRCWELWKLVEQVAKLPVGDIIEVGTWRGGTSAVIAKQAERCLECVDCRVFLCDTFKGTVKATAKDSTYRGGEHADTSLEIVCDLVYDKMNLSNVDILEGVFPDETGRELEQLQFRFCHIDVDIYQSAKDITYWIWPRMVRGGVIVYDDYGFEGCDGVTKVVEEQTWFGDRLVLHNLNGHAIVIKL